ncbi:hypothetical protein HMPREF1556_00271, partial [Porphyromonas sp. oral taxon 278 str. W7784]
MEEKEAALFPPPFYPSEGFFFEHSATVLRHPQKTTYGRSP